MSAEDLKKNVDTMKDAFNVVVKAATQPIQARIDEKIEALTAKLTAIDTSLHTLSANVEHIEEDVQEFSEAVASFEKGISRITEQLDKEQSAYVVLNSLASSLSTCNWEDKEKERI